MLASFDGPKKYFSASAHTLYDKAGNIPKIWIEFQLDQSNGIS